MEKRVIDVLKSKRFWVMVISVVVMLLIAIEPRFAGSEDQLINNITFIALLLIGGYSLQDVALAWLSQSGNINLTVEAAAEMIDVAENVLHIDIPDGLEAEGKAEFQRRLQALVDSYKAKTAS